MVKCRRKMYILNGNLHYETFKIQNAFQSLTKIVGDWFCLFNLEAKKYSEEELFKRMENVEN